MSTSSNNKKWVSWNANLQHDYQNLYTIKTEEELSNIVAKASKVRVFGNKQSSADIVGGVDTLIDIREYNQILNFDDIQKTITVQAGITLEQLIDSAEAKGWCIPCLPDINTVTLAGALATGTHGTSGKLLSEYVVATTVVLADGTVKEIKENNPLMDAYRVSLGALGVTSTITIQCEKLYTLHLKEQSQKDENWLKGLKEKVAKHDFVRILWMPHTGHGYEIIGDKIPEDKEIKTVEGSSFLRHRRTVSKFLYQFTHRLPWFTAIANKIIYRLFFTSEKEHKGSLYQATVTKSRGSTLELGEWTVDIDVFPEVFQKLKTEINKWSNDAFIHIPMDIRFVKKDSAWLSYAYEKDIVTMGCVCRNTENADSYEAFKTVEKIFLEHGGKPHWAKRFDAKEKELSVLYPKWEDFKKLRQEYDPTDKFLNPYLKAIFC